MGTIDQYDFPGYMKGEQGIAQTETKLSFVKLSIRRPFNSAKRLLLTWAPDINYIGKKILSKSSVKHVPAY